MIKKMKVLVLDDSELQRAKIQDLFLNNEEFELVGCLNDGLEGINIVRDEQPDVVIADIVLQNYDGFELLEKIKEMSFVSKPKILILSSLKGDDFAQKALDLGASYYMVKPVAEEILLKRIKSLVDSNSNSDTQLIRNGRNRVLEEKISNVFITVGIPAHIKGYQFLREAIKMAIRQPEIINSITKQLYPAIANLFSTSASKVERAIRHAIEVAWNRVKIENINALFGIKVYNTNEKPTNGEFIALVADKMLIEGA